MTFSHLIHAVLENSQMISICRAHFELTDYMTLQGISHLLWPLLDLLQAKSSRKKCSATFLDQWKAFQRGNEKIPKKRERKEFTQRAKWFRFACKSFRRIPIYILSKEKAGALPIETCN